MVQLGFLEDKEILDYKAQRVLRGRKDQWGFQEKWVHVVILVFRE